MEDARALDATAEAAPPVAHRFPRTARYIGDLIYGANDGIITTFAIVAGVAGAALSARIVIVLGVANLLADGFSMAASNVLAIRSRAAVDRQHGATAPVHSLRHGTATFVAFVTAGSVPLAAYVLPVPVERRFAVATVLTLLTLFAVGAARTAVTRGRWWRDGLEMLAIGALAAAVAWGVGRLLAITTGISGA